MKHILQIIAFLTLAACDLLRTRPVADMANAVEGTVTTHPGQMTRKAGAAITTPKRLVKPGASAGLVILNGAADKPIGSIDDIAGEGEGLNVNLLGSANKTHVIDADGEFEEGHYALTAADGKVQDEEEAADGSYWRVGVFLNSGEDDEAEIDPMVPVAVTLST